MDKNGFLRAMLAGEMIEGWTNSATPGDLKLWRILDDKEAFTMFAERNDSVRVRPTLTPVDMSVLVGSGIDCTFTGGGDYRHGPLIGICGENYHLGTDSGAHSAHSRCRPRMDHWHSLMNIKRGSASEAVTDDLVSAGFELQFLNGSIKITLQEGYCMPWESGQ